MTVRKLISQLKKMPPNMQVYWADHDHGTYETNNIANRVNLIDPADAEEWEKEIRTPGNPEEKYVVIRP